MGRRFARAGLALAVGLAAPVRAPAQDGEGCAPAGGAPERIVAVTDRLEFRLADGRLVRSPGLAAAPADFLGSPAGEAARRALAQAAEGRAALVEPLGGPDRWGRAPSRLFFLDERAPAEAGELALSLGAARLGDAGEAGRCGPALRKAEAAARAAGLGLWSDPYYAVLDAGDGAGLAMRDGQFVLVEGVVRRVGTGRVRVYLDFGPRRDDFSVTILKRRAPSFQASGLTLAALAGRRVRVRGVVEAGPGPRMEIAGPGALELIGAPP
ncbi:MAG: hypothetical protein IPL88_04610 [Rhizobiales bacterium]|nr:hypothetical protein [Hyphomicrobiales bacterium]